MREIPLTQGKVALVDDADYESVMRYSWTAYKDTANGLGDAWYVRRATCNAEGKPVSLHREIMGVTDPKVYVDHRDHNPLNNTRGNLRICTPRQNTANRRPYRNTLSRFKGVSTTPNRKKWRAYVGLTPQVYLGIFEKEEDAARAYDAKAREVFGEFALLNFPDEAFEALSA